MAGERYTEEFKIAAVKQRKIEESRVRSCNQALRLLLVIIKIKPEITCALYCTCIK